jgi:hypothetical protein
MRQRHAYLARRNIVLVPLSPVRREIDVYPRRGMPRTQALHARELGDHTS